MAKLHGIEFKTDWKQAIVHVRIKRWYMPFFIAKHLHRAGLPLRYWPVIYWRYYVIRGEYRPHG